MSLDAKILEQAINDLRKQAQDLAKDGLSFSDAGAMVLLLISRGSAFIAAFTSASDEEKKKFVVDVANQAYEVASPFLYTGWFFPLKWALDPLARMMLPVLVEGVYSILVDNKVVS